MLALLATQGICALALPADGRAGGAGHSELGEPYNPLAPILDSLTRPYLRPFERLRIGAVDLGPLVLLLILQMLVGIPLAQLEWLLLSQMQMLM